MVAEPARPVAGRRCMIRGLRDDGFARRSMRISIDLFRGFGIAAERITGKSA
jgi:hypothetical protein